MFVTVLRKVAMYLMATTGSIGKLSTGYTNSTYTTDTLTLSLSIYIYNNNNNNIYLLQLGCHPVAVVILHVKKTWNWLLLDLSREGYMRSV